MGRCKLTLPVFLDFSEHKGELLLLQPALPRQGHVNSPPGRWLCCSLATLPSLRVTSQLPSQQQSPVQLQSCWGKRCQPLLNPNPADANGHVTLFIMTFLFLPGQPTRRSLPHSLLLQPSHLPPRLPAGPALHHGVSAPALHPFTAHTRTQVWKRRQSRWEPA